MASTTDPRGVVIALALTTLAGCPRADDACFERFHVDSSLYSSGVDDGVITAVSSTSAALEFRMEGVDEDGQEFRGDARFPLVGEERGIQLEAGFSVELQHSDGALRPVIRDGDVLVFSGGDPYEARAADHAEPASEQVREAMEGPCHAASFDEGSFAGLRFNDDDETAVPAGEAKIGTYGESEFILATAWAFLRNDGGFDGWGYAWRKE